MDNFSTLLKIKYTHTMKKLSLIILALILISAAVDIVITSGEGTTASTTSVNWGGTITKDVHIDPDTTGKGYICFGCKKGIAGWQAYAKDSIDHKTDASIFMSPGLVGMSSNDKSTPSGKGVSFFVGNDGSFLIDTNIIPSGIVYGNLNYETQPGSLTSKFYVDKNILKSVTKTTMGSAALPNRVIFVSNATGGACPAYNDGTNWRRFSDNSIIN